MFFMDACQGVDDVAFDAGQVMDVAWVRVYGST